MRPSLVPAIAAFCLLALSAVSVTADYDAYRDLVLSSNHVVARDTNNATFANTTTLASDSNDEIEDRDCEDDDPSPTSSVSSHLDSSTSSSVTLPTGVTEATSGEEEQDDDCDEDDTVSAQPSGSSTFVSSTLAATSPTHVSHLASGNEEEEDDSCEDDGDDEGNVSASLSSSGGSATQLPSSSAVASVSGGSMPSSISSNAVSSTGFYSDPAVPTSSNDADCGLVSWVSSLRCASAQAYRQQPCMLR